MDDVIVSAASRANQPEATIKALCRLAQETIGAKLFTILEIDHERGVAWRSFSNMPDAYPPSGEKPVLLRTLKCKDFKRCKAK